MTKTCRLVLYVSKVKNIWPQKSNALFCTQTTSQSATGQLCRGEKGFYECNQLQRPLVCIPWDKCKLGFLDTQGSSCGFQGYDRFFLVTALISLSTTETHTHFHCLSTAYVSCRTIDSFKTLKNFPPHTDTLLSGLRQPVSQCVSLHVWQNVPQYLALWQSIVLPSRKLA